MINYTKTILALASAFAFSQLAHGALWTGGHGDLGIAYEISSSGYDLEPHWHLGEDNEPVTLDGTSGPLGPEGAEYEADEITPVTSLTQSIGGSSYFVFPATEISTVPFIGFGTEELSAGDWTGDLTLSLTGASGPGSFYLFSIDSFGVVSTLMDSSDGFSTVDSIALAPESHTHHTWAFTEQGDYSLTFQVDGTHTFDGAQSGSATYDFSVVPEPSTAGLLLGAAALILTVVRRRVS
jgi:surface-anchored protein